MESSKTEFYLTIKDKYHLGKITYFNKPGFMYVLRTFDKDGNTVEKRIALTDEEYDEMLEAYWTIEQSVEKGLSNDPNNRAVLYPKTVIGVSSKNTNHFVHELKDKQTEYENALAVESRIWHKHPEVKDQLAESSAYVHKEEEKERIRREKEEAEEEERKAGLKELHRKYPFLFKRYEQLSNEGVKLIGKLMDEYTSQMTATPEDKGPTLKQQL